MNKDGECRNNYDSPLTSIAWTPVPNARHLPTQTNPLLGACIWHVKPMSLIQVLVSKTHCGGQKLIQSIGRWKPQNEQIGEEQYTKKKYPSKNTGRQIENTRRSQRKSIAVHPLKLLPSHSVAVDVYSYST